MTGRLQRSLVTVSCLTALCCTDSQRVDEVRTATEASVPTFSRDIAPLLYRECMPCHLEDRIGPIALETYEDVAPLADRIARVTRARSMPPWPADAGFSRFREERVLTDEEIGLIARWLEAGSPEGDPAILPPIPVNPAGSELGTPDLVVEMPEPYEIEGNGVDHFVVVRVPFEVPQDTFVRAVEFVPGNRALVHHMNGHLIVYEPGKKTNLFEGETFTEDAVHNPAALESLNLRNDDGSFAPIFVNLVNYLPGMSPTAYPNGLSYLFPLMAQNVFLMNDVHYGPSTRDTFDLSHLNIWYGPRPERVVREFILGTYGVAKPVPELIIPPDTVMDFHIEYEVPRDISVLSLNPHMHLLGKSIKAYAVTRMYQTIPLIHIPRWDFHWQYTYTFPRPVHIPSGSTLVVEATYDNTAENPHNPFSPPRTVREHEGSMKSTDEMLQLIVSWTPYRPGDELLDLTEVSLE